MQKLRTRLSQNLVLVLLVLSHRREKSVVDNKTAALVIDNKSIFPFEKEHFSTSCR